MKEWQHPHYLLDGALEDIMRNQYPLPSGRSDEVDPNGSANMMADALSMALDIYKKEEEETTKSKVSDIMLKKILGMLEVLLTKPLRRRKHPWVAFFSLIATPEDQELYRDIWSAESESPSNAGSPPPIGFAPEFDEVLQRICVCILEDITPTGARHWHRREARHRWGSRAFSRKQIRIQLLRRFLGDKWAKRPDWAAGTPLASLVQFKLAEVKKGNYPKDKQVIEVLEGLQKQTAGGDLSTPWDPPADASEDEVLSKVTLSDDIFLGEDF